MPIENLSASEKNLLREKMRTRRRQLDPAWKAAASQAIISRLEALPIFQKARTIHAYVAWRNEVDTHDLILRLLQERRRVAVPKVDQATGQLQHYFITGFSELQKGAFGILEPLSDPGRRAAPSQFDLVLVPGLAFDRAGNRLGMGKGHYDRFLVEVHAPKIALAYDFQLVEKLPVEAHDQRVNIIITEKNVISCS
jgi:5-formyltetrahydrofolate cyclo-ligase